VKRRLRLAFLLAIVGASVLCTVALAGDVTGADSSGDVKAPGLTAAERAAIDIVRVQAVGQANLGVVVTATFRGNFEQLVGHGHLKTAAAALVLVPKPGAGAPAGVLTQGPDDGTVLRQTRTTDVGAVRDGRTVTFYVVGTGYENVAGVEVRTVAKVPPSGRALAADPPDVSSSEWAYLLHSQSDRAAVAAQVNDLTCPQLDALRSSLEARLAKIERRLERKKPGRGRDHLLRDHAELESLLDQVNSRLVGCGGTPPPTHAASCTLQTLRDGSFPTIEVNIHARCGALIRQATLTFPSTQTINAFLPSGCSASGSVLTCPNLSVPANTDFEIDARFSAPFPPGATFNGVFVLDTNTFTTNGTFPGP
jgi:hypothetical protein